MQQYRAAWKEKEEKKDAYIVYSMYLYGGQQVEAQLCDQRCYDHFIQNVFYKNVSACVYIKKACINRGRKKEEKKEKIFEIKCKMRYLKH